MKSTPRRVKKTVERPSSDASPRPLAWYGGSWAYADPDPMPDPREERAKRRAAFKPSEFGPEVPPGQGDGLILGRFMPPHRGHQFLVDFARAVTPSLTIVMRVAPDDPIPGDLRAAWLREMFPDAKVHTVRRNTPLSATDASDEAEYLKGYITRTFPQFTYLFGSEFAYRAFAESIGAAFVPVDIERRTVPVSGTVIRANPLAHWDDLPACVRPHYLRRVCVVGPESTGKTTLARRLAAHFNTVAVEEYARSSVVVRDWQPADTQAIARGQIAAEAAAARLANKLLVCDTGPFLIRKWSERLFGAVPAWVAEADYRERYDLYLVTEPDVPYVGDSAFNEPVERQQFFNQCLLDLGARKRPYLRIKGDWEERFETARAAVAALLDGNGAPGGS